MKYNQPCFAHSGSLKQKPTKFLKDAIILVTIPTHPQARRGIPAFQRPVVDSAAVPAWDRCHGRS